MEKVDPNRMLLREFIHDRLYGLPDEGKKLPGGYFIQEKH